MMTAGTPPRGDDDMPDHPATQPGTVHDGANSFAPVAARHNTGLPGGNADTLDQLPQVPVWPGPPPPMAKARRRRSRIRETLPEVGIVTLVLVVLGGLLASAVLTTATVTVYDHPRHHGAVITKTAGRPAPRPGAGVTPSARPGLPLGTYLVPRTVAAATSPSRLPVPASSLPGTPGTSPAASTAPPRSSPATPPGTVTTTPTGRPPPSASATPPPASTPASTPAPTTPPPAPTTPPPAPTPTPTPTTRAGDGSARAGEQAGQDLVDRSGPGQRGRAG